ncbi:MAG: histidine-type phosphatase, partial [Prevotella sp.]|nr:histidine-type phosphatase [Prevotella sp.]
MKKLHTALLLLALLLPLATLAQQSLTDINGRRELSASNYLAYPGPQQRQLTPAPEGYTPCYISHYGRHGS